MSTADQLTLPFAGFAAAVGCALVFPEFLETCRDHVHEYPDMMIADFEAFESDCLQQDGLSLVEYAISLVNQGCILDLEDTVGRRLQDSPFLGATFGSDASRCSWDEIDD